ncbi:MAG: oligopeptidase A [Proteobacteria bacterium]|uniref:oligopeptidase A n=1 Tax=Candidatus Avisuccinivibrio stercorigallinarum TaxID=2840704 RepID=A0A9D9D9V7_9GAMM|nr:oligopeptidase A [Candidatus Avisuccinivibrio stercorigallinarum]
MAEDFNPLLHIEGLPIFSALKPEHIYPAVKQAIDNCVNVIKQVSASEVRPTWDSVIAPIEEADDKFSKIWAVVSHLNGVCNTKELRAAHDSCLPLIAEYSTWAGQYQPLFEVLKRIRQSDEFLLLTAAQRKAIENSLRDFKLTGVDLPAKEKERFAQITAELSQLQSDFANHVLDATHSFVKQVTNKEELSGIPAGALKLAKAEAEKRQLEGWVFTLDMPSYLPLLMYADNRELRREMYEAYNTRASELGPDAGKFDNFAVMEQILKLRHEMAGLLGYKSYAHLSLATKMAKEPKEVMDFLEDLARRSKPQGRREMAELEAYAKEQGCDKLEPWDVTYYSEKLKQAQFSISEEELRPYFPVDKVVAGLFECARRVYDISIRPRYGVDVWHDDVSCYDVYDSFGSKIGTFYLDLYARAGKRGGAWMDECQSRRYRKDGALQLPVAYLVCNFTPPVGGKQAQLTHGEVVTLFHEFGHGLNQLLTRIDIADVSGINGVPWDAVELPSQFNEEFAWQSEVLNFLSSKVGTGEPLPEEKLKALLAAKNYHSAMAMLRQLEFALFDFKLHLDYMPELGGRIFETQRMVRDEVSVVPQYPNSRFANSFTHIFAGGYAAGYYSYKWAEVLAADAFGRLLEEGIFSGRAGRDFRDCILAVGGAEDPMTAFIKFRGRRPSVEALLKQSGISTEPEAEAKA